jgi:uncharacterized protein YneF (UPF0154 family)
MSKEVLKILIIMTYIFFIIGFLAGIFIAIQIDKL